MGRLALCLSLRAVARAVSSVDPTFVAAEVLNYQSSLIQAVPMQNALVWYQEAPSENELLRQSRGLCV